jgi:hypothetical protein
MRRAGDSGWMFLASALIVIKIYDSDWVLYFGLNESVATCD